MVPAPSGGGEGGTEGEDVESMPRSQILSQSGSEYMETDDEDVDENEDEGFNLIPEKEVSGLLRNVRTMNLPISEDAQLSATKAGRPSRIGYANELVHGLTNLVATAFKEESMDGNAVARHMVCLSLPL